MRGLLDLIGDVHGCSSLAEFRETLIDGLWRTLPCDWVAYNEVGRGPEDTFVLSRPKVDQNLVPRFAELADENPLIRSMRITRDGRPRRISDMIDRDTFHATAIYREVYAVMQVEAQVAFTLPAGPPLVLGIALSRGAADFTDEEVELLALARPHLIQAYRNVELASAREATLAAIGHGLNGAGQHVIVLDAHGRLEFATEGALRMLGANGASKTTIPAEVQQWIAARSNSSAASQPLVLGSGLRVLVRLLPSKPEDRRVVLLLQGDLGELSVAALESLGLTAREAEVLRRTALGETAGQTAGHLSISPRTAEKHLQSVYNKLGVHSRSDAAAVAWAAIGVQSPVERAVPDLVG